MSDRCPECHRPTIWRSGGEWCRFCVGWVQEVRLHHIETGPGVVRVLRRAFLH